MSKFVGIISLMVGGIIVADILIHPAGTKAATTGVTNLSRPWINGLLGTPS